MLNTLSYQKIVFPKGFLWGSATAAHQIEGGDIHSVNNRNEIKHHYTEVSGRACDHWKLYKEDAALLKELGHQVYRLSLSWARVEPEEDRYDKRAINHYIAELKLLKELGIQVYLTLYHGSAPVWFADRGGFDKRENVRCFENYVRHMVPILAEFVDSFIIINEFNLSGGSDLAAAGEVHRNYLAAHSAGYHIVKEFSKVPVSSAHALRANVPENPHDRLDSLCSELDDYLRNEFFFRAIRTGEAVSPYFKAEKIDGLKDSLDYWAVNYYCRTVVSSREKNLLAAPPESERLRMIDKDFYLENVCPEGFVSDLVRLSDKPVFITENGISADDDRWRILKLAMDLAAMNDAMKKGVDIRGYLHWSLMDNYEWSSFVPRFGLVHVDFNTMKRTPKPSAYFYRDIIKKNAFDGKLVRKYIPEMPVLKLYNE